MISRLSGTPSRDDRYRRKLLRLPVVDDHLQVARAAPRGDTCAEGTSLVPFRVVRLDGSQLRSIACVADARVTQLTDPIGSTDPVFPSEGGPPIQDERAGARDIAIAIGVALVMPARGWKVWFAPEARLGRAPREGRNALEVVSDEEPLGISRERYYYEWYVDEATDERSDGEIEQDLLERIRTGPYADHYDIEVDVKKGVVILTGTARTSVAKRAAGDDAWDTRGVTDVSNPIQVRSTIPVP